MNVNYAPATLLYGLRLDCAKEGCDPKHADDGSVMQLDPKHNREVYLKPQFISGHAATLVVREIPDWQVAAAYDPANKRALREEWATQDA